MGFNWSKVVDVTKVDNLSLDILEVECIFKCGLLGLSKKSVSRIIIDQGDSLPYLCGETNDSLPASATKKILLKITN